MQALPIEITGAGGDRIEAYTATPLAKAARGGVVVIHHMPGFDAASKEIVRRFASVGYDAIAPNLHYREAPGADADDAAAANRAAGGVPDDRLVGDVSACADWLRARPANNGKVGVIGYCSGGRQSLLAACSLRLDAAVDCYGAFVMADANPRTGASMSRVGDLLDALPCPLLGLFGAQDQYPGPDEVAELDARLSELGKDHEFHSFEDAGHAFFSVDRPSYRQEAATRGWRLVEDFFDRRLGALAPGAGQEG